MRSGRRLRRRRHRAGRPGLLALLLGGVLAAALIVAGAVGLSRVTFPPSWQPEGAPAPAATDPDAVFGPPASAPERSSSPGRPGVAGLAAPAWLERVASETGIPERALAAYAGVALAKSDDAPACRIAWNTIAAIGYVESRHGSYRGASIADDGAVSPPIIGIPLDGGDTAEVTDSDGGAIDGDTEHDRAVGPMQHIPESWRNWHIDANADGRDDPHNIDDAAYATANYLCRAGGDLGEAAGWRAAVTAYNWAPSYRVAVAEAAVAYAEAAG